MDKPVRIFSLSTCSNCKATKQLLGKCEVAYEFTDVDLLNTEERKAILEDIRAFNPECSFPTIVIGKKVIVGFNEQQILEALGLLEAPIVTFFKKLFRFFKPGGP
jgi:glutaredoxin-like protein NrdH